MLELLDLRDRRERLEPRRLEIDPHVSDTVRSIVERVRRDGDAALLELTLELDDVDLRKTGLIVPGDELEAAAADVPHDVRDALDSLIERLADLHRRQLPDGWENEREGVRFGEVVRAMRAAGCYVPGGRAVYPSSVAMTVTPAVVAGVEEVVVTTPPGPGGRMHPEVLYAAARAGATTVVRVGGAQAVAALAYGTETVPAVDMVVGPGNAYVTEAKRQLNGVIGIDGLAGPTELVLVAGPEADPRWVALDLIAQAEHDPEAVATLVALDEGLVVEVQRALEAEVPRAARREVVEAALGRGRVILVRDWSQATDVANDLAPEHLAISIAAPDALTAGIRNAGAIFVGAFTAVPFGDYGVASNHVLPTGGTARFSSGLRAADFVKVMSIIEMDEAAAASLGPEVAAVARSESLDGHARAVEARAAGRGARP